jgi:hypothetical protein
MLQIVDNPNKYSVMRLAADAAGVMRRARIGIIPKATLEVPPELQSTLTPEEVAELAKYLTVLKSAVALKRKMMALSLPETLRIAVEYATTDATDAERSLVTMAIVDAGRKIRKHAAA